MTVTHSNRPIQVLVVDDNVLTADAHVELVNRVDGFSAGPPAHSGREALTRVLHAREQDSGTPGAHPIDLVLLDLTLPDLNGLEVARALRSRGSTVTIIAVTAVRETAVVRSALSLGIVHYLIKPFSFATLRERLHAYLDYSTQVGTTGTTDQSSINASLVALQRSAGSLPKGISSSTLAQVRAVVEGGAGVTSAAVAEMLGLSRVTARRYLELLAEHGVVQRTSRYGTPGRPESEYRLR
ncbi:MAG: response regulator [Mycetocola sp.]